MTQSHPFRARPGESRIPTRGDQRCAICDGLADEVLHESATWPKIPRADIALGEPLTATGILRSITTLDREDTDLPAGRARIVLEVELDF